MESFLNYKIPPRVQQNFFIQEGWTWLEWRASLFLPELKTNDCSDTENHSGYLHFGEYISEFPIADTDIGPEVDDLHDEWGDRDILETVALCEKIERDEINENSNDIPFPYIGIICPHTEYKVSYSEKESCSECEPKS